MTLKEEELATIEMKVPRNRKLPEFTLTEKDFFGNIKLMGDFVLDCERALLESKSLQRDLQEIMIYSNCLKSFDLISREKINELKKKFNDIQLKLKH